MFFTFFLLAISIGYLTFILNYTEFVAEYGKVAPRFFLLDEYSEWKQENEQFGYPVFIREKFPNFWGRLVGCPYCLVTFSNLVLQSLFVSPLLFLVGAFVSVLCWAACTLIYFTVNKNYE